MFLFLPCLSLRLAGLRSALSDFFRGMPIGWPFLFFIFFLQQNKITENDASSISGGRENQIVNQGYYNHIGGGWVS
jgi:phosphatidylserine synthase